MKISNIKLGKSSINCIEDLYPLLDDEFKNKYTERFFVIGLHNNIIETVKDITEDSSVYTANFSFNKLIESVKGCTSFIVTHNHPNGVAIPSSNDIKTTKKISRLAIVNNIYFIEHILCVRLADGSFFHWLINSKSVSLNDTLNVLKIN